MAFFETLNFSSANEDGASELAALEGSTRILCITGSGTRPLDMLLTAGAEVVALDANPVQNALLELKMAAMAVMDREAYLAFIGIAEGTDRSATYAGLRGTISPQARAYWDTQPGAIAKGVWYAGQWERLLRWNARFLRLLRGRKVRALMQAADRGAQHQLWRQGFSGGGRLAMVEALARDLVWRLVMREPAAAHMPPASEVAAYIEARFAAATTQFLLRDSDCATLALLGRHSPEGALPVHLSAENYQTVRGGLPRLRIVTASLHELAERDPGGFDGFSLSDFGSYCSQEDYGAHWRAILASASPGSRYCERIFLNEMALPDPRIAIDQALSDRLSASDRSVIYRIRAGTIGTA